MVISDSLVVATEKTKEDLQELVFIIGKIQYELFLKGILIRGGISFGKLYVNKSKNVIVGPGLINAYKLESIAKFPRIIIDRKIIPEFFSSSTDFVNFMNSTDKFNFDYEGEIDGRILFESETMDGKFYINFMRMVVRYGPTYQTRHLEKITAFFQTNIYINEYFEKYNWLVKELLRELHLADIHYTTNVNISSKTKRLNGIKKLRIFLENL